MKKYIALFLAAVMLLGCCVGCANKTPEVSDPVVNSDPDVSTTTSAQDDTTDTTDQVADSTDEVTDTTDDTTDTTGEDADATDESSDTTTEADKTTTSTTKGEDKGTTTKKAETTTTKGETTTKKAETTTTKKTTTKKTTTKNTTTKNTTTKNTTTKTTTTVTTTKTTTTVVTTTTTTRYRPGITTTTKGDSGITVPSQNGVDKGYEFDPGDEWELYWNDEFDGKTLDTTKWTCESGTTTIYIEKEENVTVQGGNLILTARNADPSTNKGKKFTTGAVNTGDKFSFQYGRLEFRARLPYGEGVHPGLWTMGNYYRTTNDELGWPRCGEIDVMELVGAGGEADQYTESYNRRTTCNLHWGANRDEHREIGTTSYYIQDGSLADDYHVYACEWDEESITFYFDDIKIAEKKLNDPDMGDAFKQPHWIIMSFSLDSKGQHIADETTPLPQSMYVDYVRVYKKK